MTISTSPKSWPKSFSEDGFVISELRDGRPAAIQAEVARLEPDVVLLDGGDGTDYGLLWLNATWMRERSRPFPAIMFTAYTRELAKAQLGKTERSKSAAFVGFLPKPCDLRILVETVARVVEEPAAARLLSVAPKIRTGKVQLMRRTVPGAGGMPAC